MTDSVLPFVLSLEYMYTISGDSSPDISSTSIFVTGGDTTVTAGSLYSGGETGIRSMAGVATAVGCGYLNSPFKPSVGSNCVGNSVGVLTASSAFNVASYSVSDSAGDMDTGDTMSTAVRGSLLLPPPPTPSGTSPSILIGLMEISSMSLGGALGNGGALSSTAGKGGSTFAATAIVISLLIGRGEVTVFLLIATTGGQFSAEWVNNCLGLSTTTLSCLGIVIERPESRLEGVGGTDVFVTLDGVSYSGVTDPALMFSIDNGYILLPPALGEPSTVVSDVSFAVSFTATSSAF